MACALALSGSPAEAERALQDQDYDAACRMACRAIATILPSEGRALLHDGGDAALELLAAGEEGKPEGKLDCVATLLKLRAEQEPEVALVARGEGALALALDFWQERPEAQLLLSRGQDIWAPMHFGREEGSKPFTLGALRDLDSSGAVFFALPDR